MAMIAPAELYCGWPLVVELVAAMDSCGREIAKCDTEYAQLIYGLTDATVGAGASKETQAALTAMRLASSTVHQVQRSELDCAHGWPRKFEFVHQRLAVWGTRCLAHQNDSGAFVEGSPARSQTGVAGANAARRMMDQPKPRAQGRLRFVDDIADETETARAKQDQDFVPTAEDHAMLDDEAVDGNQGMLNRGEELSQGNDNMEEARTWGGLENFAGGTRRRTQAHIKVELGPQSGTSDADSDFGGVSPRSVSSDGSDETSLLDPDVGSLRQTEA